MLLSSQLLIPAHGLPARTGPLTERAKAARMLASNFLIFPFSLFHLYHELGNPIRYGEYYAATYHVANRRHNYTISYCPGFFSLALGFDRVSRGNGWRTEASRYRTKD